MHRRPLVLLLAVAALAFTACGAEAESSDTDGATQGTEVSGAIVPELLRFTAPLVGGGTFDGASAAGKPTVFWFWAPG